MSNKIIIISTYVQNKKIKSVNIEHYNKIYKINPLNARLPYFMLPQLLSQYFFFVFTIIVYFRAPSFELFLIRIYDLKSTHMTHIIHNVFRFGLVNSSAISKGFFMYSCCCHDCIKFVIFYFLTRITTTKTEEFTGSPYDNPSLHTNLFVILKHMTIYSKDNNILYTYTAYNSLNENR